MNPLVNPDSSDSVDGSGERDDSDWLRAQELRETRQITDCRVLEWNRGGVIVEFGPLRGFVPNSQLDSAPRGARLEQHKAALVGQVLSLVVIEVDRRRKRLVLSERDAARFRRSDALRELNTGDVHTGTVTGLTPFGVFVDLGGVEGLVHISELDRVHVTHPRDVLRVGDEVDVLVLSVDRKRERINLSRKQLIPDPWDVVTDRLRPGRFAEGTVTNVVDYGAFVDLGQGVEGLVHVSEMPDGSDVPESVCPGAIVTVRVLSIDDSQRRIALSLRNAI